MLAFGSARAGATVSSIARWSYKNTAWVRPLLETTDRWSGARQYGEPYEIACNWIAEHRQERANDGQEFIGRHTFFTEDPRPKFMDQIRREGFEDWEEIRSTTNWEMAMFNDTPDFRLVTG